MEETKENIRMNTTTIIIKTLSDFFTIKKIVIILIFTLFLTYFYYWYKECFIYYNIPSIRNKILKAEILFLDNNYSNSYKIYTKILKIIKNPPLYLKERKELSYYLMKVKEYIKKGECKKLDNLLKKIKKKEWSYMSYSILKAHLKYLESKIKKIKLYIKNIKELIKAVQDNNIKKFKKLLEKIKNNPQFPKYILKENILDKIKEKKTIYLKVAWEYKKEIGISNKDIFNSIGKDEDKRVKNIIYYIKKDKKLLQIFLKIFDYSFRKKIAKNLIEKELKNIKNKLKKEEILNIVLLLEPYNFNYYILKGDFYTTLGNKKKALENYEKAQRYSLALMFNKKAWVELLAHNYPKSLEYWEQSINYCNNLPFSNLGLSILYSIFKNNKKSLKYLKNSLILESGKILYNILKDNKVNSINIENKKFLYSYLPAYIYLIYSTQNNKLNKKYLQKALNYFKKYNILPFEVYLYIDLANNNILELNKIKEKNCKNFFKLMYYKLKNDNNHVDLLNNLPLEWKNFYNKIIKNAK